MHRISILFLLFIALNAGCIRHNKDSGKIITATLKGPSAMAMIQMIDEKPSLEGGISTEFIIRNEPNQVKAMIMKGEADFAVIPSTMGALLYNKDQPYLLAAIPVWGTLYLFGKDTTIRSWQDLKGKKISVLARGMTPDIVFRYLAERMGLNPSKDMILDYSFPTHIELANAMASGISDLGVVSEPLVSMIMEKNPAVSPILDLDQEWRKITADSIPFAQTALLVRKELAERSPGLVNEYLSLLNRSIMWVNQNPVQASRLIVQYEVLPDTSLARKSIPRCNLRYAQAYKEMKGINEYLKVFYNFNPLIIGGKLPDEKFYYKEQAD